MLSITGSQLPSPHVGRRGSASAHVGSHRPAELQPSCRSNVCSTSCERGPPVRGGAIAVPLMAGGATVNTS
jgi:hypothetical protein